MNNTIKLIEELEEVILNGKKMPFTGKILIDGEKLSGLIENIRESFPMEINQAKKILSEKQAVIEDAQTEAARILDKAKNEASRLINESEITKQAELKAESIVKQGEEEIKKHVINVLNQLKGVVERLYKDIEKEINKLENS